MARNGTLTPAQLRAITSLLTERNTRDAAKAARVGERTLYKWLKDDTFRAELTRQEGAAVDEVTRGLLSIQRAALTELSDLIGGLGGVPAATRLQAVKIALEYFTRYREMNTYEQRLQRLENGEDERGE